MADGGDFSSIPDGSDADFDFTCTPCGEDNIREEAVKYCPECQEYLCSACTRHHGRQKATRSHKLVIAAHAKHASTVIMTAKCRYHADRDIEMYCGAHDMVYCTKCIATKHRTCDNVKHLEELHNFRTLQTDINHTQHESLNTLQHLFAKCKEKNNNISSLEEQRSEIQREIQNVGKMLKLHIDGLIETEADSLTKSFTDVTNQLESDVNLLNDTIKELEESKKNMQQVVTNFNVTQKFVYLKLFQNTVNHAEKVIDESEKKGKQTLDFTENKVLRNAITKVKNIGRVVVKSDVQKPYTLTSIKKITVKMKMDQYQCCISDICQLQDGTILLTDFNNEKLKRLDDNFKVQDHIDLDDKPTAVCCTGQNVVAVKMSNDMIQFIAVGSMLSKVRQISIEGGGCWGMAYCDGNLWVSTGYYVTVHSTNGKRLRTVVKDASDQTVFKGATQHMAVSDGTVIVTDNCDGAVCFGNDGTVREEFRDQRLKNAIGVCLSSENTVFVSGWSSCNIVIFNSDGKCQGELLTKEDGVKDPGPLLYDIKKNCIVTACLNYGDFIHILKLSH